MGWPSSVQEGQATLQANSEHEHLRASSRAALQEGDFAKAEPLCLQLWTAEGRASDLTHYLQALLQQNKIEIGVKALEGLENFVPQHSQLCRASAALVHASGRAEAALTLLEHGCKQHPTDNHLQLAYARQLLRLQRFDDARQLLQRMQQLGDHSFAVSFNLGFACSQLQRIDEALVAFNTAQSLQPEHAITAANRITLLKDAGRVEDARKVLNAFPDGVERNRVELRGAEATLLMAEQRFEDAVAVLEPICWHHPEQPLNWLNLAASLRGLRLTLAPDVVLRRALQWHPGHNDLQQAWLQSLGELGLNAAAGRLLQQMDITTIAQKDVHLFNLLFLAVSAELLSADQLKATAQHWEQQRQDPHLRQLHRDHLAHPESISKRRLRIGYLSSDYCNHPVARFLLPVLQQHDRSQVELWGLHTGPHWDAVSEAIQRECDHWLDLRSCNDARAARVIADQRLDVLVELGGFTGNSRIGVCVHQPATVQMSYLGYPGPTHLTCVPWWIGDHQLFAQLDPVAQGSHSLAVVDGGYMTLPRPEACGAVAATGHGRVRFGSFNHARKLTTSTISLWSRLMQACPEAELVLKSFTFQNQDEQARIRHCFQRQGCDIDRLQLLPARSNFHEHLQTYNGIDVALDPIPYGGATTTAEALWMGVPVLCLSGEGMAANLAASILKSANCAEWIHRDPDDYIGAAKALACAGPRSQQQRQALIERVRQSPLNQPQRVSRELERIYREAMVSAA